MMNPTVKDCMFMGALGFTIVGSIVALRLDRDALKEVSIHLIDSSKEVALARIGDC